MLKVEYAILLIALGLSWSACDPDLEAPEPASGNADLTTVVYFGDNFLSGYQDGALFIDAQEKSIPALLSRQFQLAGSSTVKQPMMPDNDGMGLNLKPWDSDFTTKAIMDANRLNCDNTTSLGPVKTEFNAATAGAYLAPLTGSGYTNVSVPYARTGDLMDPAFGNSFASGNPNPFYHRFASNPGTSTALGDAAAANPTFSVIWTGMEDIFDYARKGGYGTTITSVSVFEARLDSILQTLIGSNGQGVIANIPDITSFPFYTLIAYNGAELTQAKADSLNDIYQLSGLTHINFVEGDNAFIVGDPAAPSGVRHLQNGEYIVLNVDIDSLQCYFMGILFQPIPDYYSLIADEMTFINAAIQDYNNVIQQKANEYNIPMVDMNTYFQTVEQGVLWDGVEFDAEFVSGGFFGLDGYHPTQKGYAMLANQFIEAINNAYQASIPPVNCPDCNGVLFP